MAAPRVLVVESDPTVASRLRASLEALAYEVVGALDSADDALAFLRTETPDIVVMSRSLGRDGGEPLLHEQLLADMGPPVVYLDDDPDQGAPGLAPAGKEPPVARGALAPAELRTRIELTLRLRTAEDELRRSQERYRLLFEESVAGVARKTLEGEILECNDSFSRIFGWDSPAELKGKSADMLYRSPAQRARVMERLRRHGAVRNLELELRRKDGTPVWVLDNSILAREPGTDREIVLATLLDISDRKALEHSLKEMAFRDPLTELPNRRAFVDRGPQLLHLSARRNRGLALLFLDLVGFKAVNDSLGHRTGDSLLKAMARRLEGSLRSADMAARVGGDEFAVILPDVEDHRSAMVAATRLQERLHEPMVLREKKVALGVRISVAFFPTHGTDFDTILTAADDGLAMAKEEEGPSVRMAPGHEEQRERWG